MLRWLEDPHRRQAAGAFNRRRVVDAFSWRASAQRLLQIYESVIAARRDMKVPA
jgi:glycosyltransferase involved in cell wall biosynthesis